MNETLSHRKGGLISRMLSFSNHCILKQVVLRQNVTPLSSSGRTCNYFHIFQEHWFSKTVTFQLNLL
uniref:Uncharacterized protein n=1 Tax=Accipiter nisus TaxID=211598 RepID=A0A8B9RZH3_9AVES